MQHDQLWNIKRLTGSKGQWSVRAIVRLHLCFKSVKDVLKCSEWLAKDLRLLLGAAQFLAVQLQEHVGDALSLSVENVCFLSVAVETWQTSTLR